MKKYRFLWIVGVLVLSLMFLTVIMAAPDDTGGPDAYGYVYIDSNEANGPVYDWVDISGTGTSVALGDDDASDALPVGFTFNFYGGDFTHFYIQSNGFLAFDEPTSLYFSNNCPLDDASPANIVAVMWDDLDPEDSGALAYYQSFTAGSCPYDSYPGACMVAQYEEFEHFPGGSGDIAGTFEAILFNDNSIVTQYEDVGSESGEGSTTGIGNSDGSVSLTYGTCNTAGHLEAGLAIKFANDPPNISVDPVSLSASQDPDTTKTVTMTISNDGGLTLDWEILEKLAANQPQNAPDALPQRLTLANPVPTNPAPRSPEAEAVMDGGFEGGFPNVYWDEYSYNFGTPLCTVAGCGTGTGTGPNTGDWWVWFGGISSYEEGFITQTVTIGDTATDMTFYLEQIVCDSAADYLEVLVDSNQIFVTDGASDLCEVLGYSLQTVDISSYADGAEHTIVFHSETFAENAGGSNFFVDDVSIFYAEPGDCVPEAISWASASPSSGQTDPDSSEVIDVIFDSTGMVTGAYTGTLCVASNDPDTPEVSVDLMMVVQDPSDGPTDVALTSFTEDIAAAMFPLWLLAIAVAAIAGGLILGRRLRKNA